MSARTLSERTPAVHKEQRIAAARRAACWALAACALVLDEILKLSRLLVVAERCEGEVAERDGRHEVLPFEHLLDGGVALCRGALKHLVLLRDELEGDVLRDDVPGHILLCIRVAAHHAHLALFEILRAELEAEWRGRLYAEPHTMLNGHMVGEFGWKGISVSHKNHRLDHAAASAA